jgi:molecular chaperone GrpE
MMKKKVPDLGKNKHNNINNSTDNKENTIPTENNEINKTGTESAGDHEDSAAENIPADESSVKISAELKSVTEKLAEMQDKYIRLSAEFDNYRKRTLREKMEMTKYAGENLFLKLIPFMDDFERALKHIDTAADRAAMKAGIDLIYGKFYDFLKQNGVKEIEALNTVFNVELHEAVAKVAVDEEDKKGKVVDVIEKGYYIQDKILRYAKVAVGE